MGATDRMSCTIVCPMVPASANVLRRKYRHHAAYSTYRNSWRRTLWGLIQGHDRAWLESNARVGTKMAVRVSLRHQRLFDADNAYSSVKPILDSLVTLGYLVGDAPHQLVLEVTQEKLRTAETRITISEAE